MKEDYLPVGSVVALSSLGTTIEAVIIGRCLSTNTEKFDYMAVVYPCGFTSANDILYFNRKAIIEVINHGYANQEENEYNKRLKNAVNNLKEE